MVGQAGGHTADVLPPIAVALQQPVKMPIFDGGHERLCIRKMFQSSRQTKAPRGARCEINQCFQCIGCRRNGEMERVKGIEPSYSAWKAAALPLSYTRVASDMPSRAALGNG
jgi:hypothetical protein